VRETGLGMPILGTSEQPICLSPSGSLGSSISGHRPKHLSLSFRHSPVPKRRRRHLVEEPEEARLPRTLPLSIDELRVGVAFERRVGILKDASSGSSSLSMPPLWLP
jgi:hypothetical protein